MRASRTLVRMICRALVTSPRFSALISNSPLAGAAVVHATTAGYVARDTKSTGFVPGPKTSACPLPSTVPPMMPNQVSMKAVARTIVNGKPLGRSSSAERLARATAWVPTQQR